MKNSNFIAIFGRANHSRKTAAIILWLATLLVAASGFAETDDVTNPTLETAVPCSDAWYRFIEEKMPTSDGLGHGPDIGSDEWQSVIEFKLGIRGNPDVPGHDDEAWCRHIDQLIRINHNSSTTNENSDRELKVRGSSFACDKTKPGSIEAMICDDKELSALDRKLANVYAATSKKAVNQYPPVLKAEQRGWIKGRDECWKTADRRECVRSEYERRIVELQALYRLVSYNGPVYFICNDNPSNEVIVTFFRTDPPTLIAEHGDNISLMYLQPSGSGSKYQGRNEMFWEHQGQALITWGYEAPEMRCIKKP
ncbi:MliC family protein [Nitrosomonas sp.]|uniref:MliC family protein n=1 Tax=Nitrosomonas sp. TaxID=42353 RepID=UPI001E064A9A|nr:MliC family protein [Nitrosomonas sp.]MBX3618065.1 MliC family protein [Nitrosomonas sp.]